MKKKPHKRQPGEYEIRVLKDGRLVLVGPDQALLDMADALTAAQQHDSKQERTCDDRNDAPHKSPSANGPQDGDG
jgi:hypothetical protein